MSRVAETSRLMSEDVDIEADELDSLEHESDHLRMRSLNADSSSSTHRKRDSGCKSKLWIVLNVALFLISLTLFLLVRLTQSNSVSTAAADVDARVSSSTSSVNDLPSLESRLAAMTEEVKSHRQQIDAITSSINSKSSTPQANTDASSSQSTASEKEAAAQQHAANIEALTAQIKEADSQRKEAENKLQAAETKAHEFEGKVQAAEAKAKAAESKLQEAASKLPAAEAAGKNSAPLPDATVCPHCFYPPRSERPPLPADYFNPGGKPRYIRYDVSKGLYNNHREAMMIALLFARLTNRTLIISSDRNGALLREVYDFYILSQYHPVISEEAIFPANYSQVWAANDTVHIGQKRPDAEIWYLSKEEYLQNPTQAQWLDTHQLECMGKIPFRARYFLDEFGPGSALWDAPLLLFEPGWGYVRTLFSGFPLRLVESMLAWSLRVLHPYHRWFEQANRVVARLPQNYIGIHWRIGDFRTTHKSDFVLTVAKVVQYIEEHCGVKAADPKVKKERAEPRMVYIATDAPSDPMISEFTSLVTSSYNLRVVLWSNYSESLYQTRSWSTFDWQMFKGPNIGILESLILSRSHCFVPAPLSSFSEHSFLLMERFGHNINAGYQADRWFHQQSKMTHTTWNGKERLQGDKPEVLFSKVAEDFEKLFKPPA